MLVLFLTILFISIHCGQSAIEAKADVRLDHTNTSIGILTFYQEDANSEVKITGTLTSLAANSELGFHVHVYGVNENMPNCTAAGPHFNPYNTAHGPKNANITSRHVGDLGNITTDSTGKTVLSMSDKIIQFYNTTQNIANRTIVVHVSSDDGGFGTGDSNTTGNAGARFACGLIKVTSHGYILEPTFTMLAITIICVFLLELFD